MFNTTTVKTKDDAELVEPLVIGTLYNVTSVCFLRRTLSCQKHWKFQDEWNTFQHLN